MESIVMPLEWADFGEEVRPAFQALRSPASDTMVLQDNMFVEQLLSGLGRPLSDAVKTEYRRPFLNPGEDRRPTLTWPRQLPIAGEPADVVEAVSTYSRWLGTTRCQSSISTRLRGSSTRKPGPGCILPNLCQSGRNPSAGRAFYP
jgi:haloalkane dehalogenase